MASRVGRVGRHLPEARCSCGGRYCLSLVVSGCEAGLAFDGCISRSLGGERQRRPIEILYAAIWNARLAEVHSDHVSDHEPELAEVFRFVSSRLLIHRRSQLAPSFHGFQHGDLIGILNIAAGGNAGCNARDFKPGSPQLS
jgi:hypothetical protein